MSECCSNNQTLKNYPKSHKCPLNGKKYSSVNTKTMLHHLNAPWSRTLIQQGYYFCSDLDCDVVYFGQDNSIFIQSDLTTPVWQKTHDEHSTVCYCFGVSLKQASENKLIKQFVIEQTQVANCSCETSSPSGRCCLKDFPKH